MKLEPRPIPDGLRISTTTVTFPGHGSGATHLISKLGQHDQATCGAKVPWQEDGPIEVRPDRLISCIGCLQFLRNVDRLEDRARRVRGRS